VTILDINLTFLLKGINVGKTKTNSKNCKIEHIGCNLTERDSYHVAIAGKYFPWRTTTLNVLSLIQIFPLSLFLLDEKSVVSLQSF